MLKGVPPFITADLLWVMASMGHGDELAIVDRNFSGFRVATQTTSGKLLILEGVDAPTAVRGILQMMPLDTFNETPLMHMEAVDAPGELLEVHKDVLAVCSEAEGRSIASQPVERSAYYPIAMRSFAVIQTAESRAYGNFILKKGVV
ncbi:RbsD/FucU family protein [Rhizobium leguminosarum]|uniref:RbsD/FucU family protein n=1 Tax=Rhizobium leguminosarum TaxID=384 RepID=UPI00103AEBD5|nr:RbsD/FucU domain-containing protein [Rhizobium leguminosarum]TCA04442.1 fucose dissimilation pathway protein FucU [Rhizobium leguminosarum bv. viciae]